MDNYFYHKNTTATRNKTKEKKKSIMTRVIIVQLVSSLVISAVLFTVCRSDSNLSNGIKKFYAEICEKDIAVSSIIDVFKNVAKQSFSPMVEDEEITENASGETNVEAGEKANFSPVFLTIRLEKPLEIGEVSSNYGYRISPITNKYSFHKGLDIAAKKNSEIYASYDGVVEKADYHFMNGNYIVLKHSDSLKTTYNHCNKLLVKTGDKVRKGDCIALVGASGYATGNHLHYEIIVNGGYINPIWVLYYDA